MDGINSYKCECDNTGYEGPTCEINIDECADQPCLHNSTCWDGINDYECACYPGYDGKNCQQDILECEEIPCKNSALCFEKSNASLYGNIELYHIIPADIKRIQHEAIGQDYIFQLKKITDIAKITESLGKAKIDILDLQAVDIDLENVFLKLTGK